MGDGLLFPLTGLLYLLSLTGDGLLPPPPLPLSLRIGLLSALKGLLYPLPLARDFALPLAGEGLLYLLCLVGDGLL